LSSDSFRFGQFVRTFGHAGFEQVICVAEFRIGTFPFADIHVSRKADGTCSFVIFPFVIIDSA
jgi:hypothetical protein